MKPNNPLLVSILSGAFYLSQASASTLLIDNNFDGVADDIGPAFQQLTNGAAGGGGTADTDTGLINNGAGVTNATGFNNVSTVDVTSVPDSIGFTVEFVIDSVVNADNIQSNGFFLGVVSGTDATGTAGTSLFNNNPASVGVRFFQLSENAEFEFLEDPQGGGAVGIVETALGTTPTLASIEDGFSVFLTINADNSWSVTSTGLSADFNTNGTLSGTTTNYAAIADDLSLFTSAQGSNVDVNVSSATLTAITIPEPTTSGLLALCSLSLLLRRKRA